MKSQRFSFALLVALLGLLPGAHAQWVEQSILLRPGWNAVFLEVDPVPEECDALFDGLAVESVWDFNRSVNSPQFVQDPSTLIPGAPGWLTWFPPSHPLAGPDNLTILRDGRPYLIKLADNAQPVTWRVTGRPSLRRLTWRAGGVNFVGFHVAVQAPSFQTLFAGEAGLVGQPVYSLDSAGVWRPFANLSTARPKPGESYWVRCLLPAQRTGTIEADPGSRQGLSFLGSAAEQSIRIRNSSTSARNISVRLLPSAPPPIGQPPLAGPVPLEYWRTDYATPDISWKPFPDSLSFAALPAGQEWNLRLGVRLAGAPAAAAGSQFQSVLEVTDDLGTRWTIPINAGPAVNLPLGGAGLRLASAPDPAGHAGLWIGEAVLNGVSQPAHLGDSSLPRPAGGEFSFRLLVHVDSTGTARLLQHVFLVRKPPISAPDPENPGFNLIVEPARTIVATDETLIPGMIGSGEIVGRRISSSAFGFDQPLALTGGAFGADTLTGVIALDYNHPLNPFKHVYHPDHNNLDERFEQTLPGGKEAFTVTRSLSLEFTATDPLGLNPPGWGDSEVGGVYSETINGLHRDTIQIRGSFRLVRVSRVAALNDG